MTLNWNAGSHHVYGVHTHTHTPDIIISFCFTSLYTYVHQSVRHAVRENQEEWNGERIFQLNQHVSLGHSLPATSYKSASGVSALTALFIQCIWIFVSVCQSWKIH